MDITEPPLKIKLDDFEKNKNKRHIIEYGTNTEINKKIKEMN